MSEINDILNGDKNNSTQFVTKTTCFNMHMKMEHRMTKIEVQQYITIGLVVTLLAIAIKTVLFG